ncbi:MAG: hypothetical protein AB1634_02765 [Thermodesulfobacteriota bacterium]
MKRFPIFLVGMLLATAPVVTAATADRAGKPMPRLFGTFAPELGVWAEYDIADKATSHHASMRMAIVGQEGEAFWYEVTNQEGDAKNIVKMLVKGDPNEPDNMQRLIIKSGDAPPLEMPKDLFIMGRRMAQAMFERRSGVPAQPAMELKTEELGKESVNVPAGTFEVSKRRIVDGSGKVYGTYRFSPAVRPFGVISSDTDTTTMTLTAHGKDAKTAITEEPVALEAPPGMPEGMPRGMPPGMMAPPRGMPPDMAPGMMAPPQGGSPPAPPPAPPAK